MAATGQTWVDLCIPGITLVLLQKGLGRFKSEDGKKQAGNCRRCAGKRQGLSPELGSGLDRRKAAALERRLGDGWGLVIQGMQGWGKWAKHQQPNFWLWNITDNTTYREGTGWKEKTGCIFCRINERHLWDGLIMSESLEFRLAGRWECTNIRIQRSWRWTFHMKESRTGNEAQTCKTNPTSFGKSMSLKEGLERIHVRRSRCSHDFISKIQCSYVHSGLLGWR